MCCKYGDLANHRAVVVKQRETQREAGFAGRRR